MARLFGRALVAVFELTPFGDVVLVLICGLLAGS